MTTALHELTETEHASLVAALGDAFPLRWGVFELSVQSNGASRDDEGDVHLPYLLAWFSAHNDVLGAVEGRGQLLHVADLVDDPNRARAFFAAWASSLPGIASVRGWSPGMIHPAEVLPPRLLEDITLQTREDFETQLGRMSWMDHENDERVVDPLDASGTQPIALDETKEAELAAWPSAFWPYVTYARWLMDRNDPRGELIVAGVGSTDRDPGVRRRHAREESRLLTVHERYFFGPFGRTEDVFFEWKLGFVKTIQLFLALDDEAPPPLAFLRGVLALPSCRLATKLVLSVRHGAFERASRHALPRWTELLVESGGHPNLARIELTAAPSTDEPYFFPVDGPPLLTESEDVEAIHASFPRAEVISRP